MAKCRICSAEIPDGKELCPRCEQLNSESVEEVIKEFLGEASETSLPESEGGTDMEKEEENAFGFDFPDELDSTYDILSDDTAFDDEFDRMLKEISDTENSTDAFLPDDEEGEIMALAADGAVLPAEVDMGAEEVATLFDGEEAAVYTEEAESPVLADIPGESPTEAGQDMDPNALFPMDGVQQDAGDDINGKNTLEAEEIGIPGKKENSMAARNEEENMDFNDGGEPQEDILDLLNSIYKSEEGAPSDGAESGEAAQYGTEDDLEMSGQDDMTDFFADVLPDEEFSSIEEITSVQEEAEDDSEKKKKKKKKEKKPGILKRVFGNIRPERTEEEVAQMKEKVIADAEAKEAEEEEKKKKAAAEKEAKKKKAADDKAASEKKKQEKAKKKAEEAKAKKEAKKEIKDKKKREVQNLIDAIDENEGRINRVGASIVFVFFAAIAIAIIIGTRVYAYSQNLENARRSFEFKHYDEAYEEIAGVKAKEEDEPFVLKVMVVMYTKKQLNSFNNYYAAGLYPEALDSLLKGLDRYDKYTALASITGITEDMDLLKGEILDKLKTIYSVSEKQAMDLNSMSDHTAYTEKVYEIAGKIAPKKADSAEAE